jgi:hypothetical protein
LLSPKLLAATALVGALSAVSPADATLTIAFTDGTNTFSCSDGSACDFAGQVGNLLTLNTTVGNFRIFGTLATETFGTTNELTMSNFGIVNNGAAGHLSFLVGDTGFSAPVSFISESASLTFNNNVGAAPGTLAFYANGLNVTPTLAAPGALLFSASGSPLSDPDSFAGTHTDAFFADAPFAMAEGATVNFKAGGSIVGFNQSMTSGVPEPSTWALLGLGFGAMALAGWKKGRATPRVLAV